jgi:GTPase SAR1 family protein
LLKLFVIKGLPKRGCHALAAQNRLFEDSIKETIGMVVKGLTNEIKFIINNRMLEYQAEEFRRNLYTKTLLHRAEPKNLFEFYVPLHIWKLDRNRRDSKIPTTSATELFKIAKRITLIGSAGSGKSTIVRYLFLNCIKENFKIPLKVELRYLNDFEGSLIQYIKEQIFKLDKISESDNIIDRLLLSGKFVIFLDGYDEINSGEKERVTKEIDDLVRVYSKNHYILTSRPYTNIDLLPSFHNFHVCDLSKDEIDEFVRKQLPNDEKELAEKIVTAVHKEENKAFTSFLNNPLLLSMFILELLRRNF